ncbi:MAG: NAD(P)-binding domain-containing protein, partial [Candidatus Phosphoribacter sp.]
MVVKVRRRPVRTASKGRLSRGHFRDSLPDLKGWAPEVALASAAQTTLVTAQNPCHDHQTETEAGGRALGTIRRPPRQGAQMTEPSPMTLGVIGLGRMGANIVRRLMADGHTAVVYDINPDAVAAMA